MTEACAQLETDVPPLPPASSAALHEIVVRALHRELARRDDLRPHAQLAIAPNASQQTIEEAWAGLRQRYQPSAYSEYGPAAVAAAEAILARLHAAYEQMRNPPTAADCAQPLHALEPRTRADETLRALETLRAAIDRRIAEAETQRSAGRVLEAITLLESVLLLDRTNAVAGRKLRELRASFERPPQPTFWGRLRRWMRLRDRRETA